MNWKLVGAIGLIVFVLQPTLRFGGIWDSRARPTKGVQVTLSDGRMLEGELSREWDGRWIVRTDDGQRASFGENDYQSMRFELPPQDGRTSLDVLLLGWRSSLPFFLITGLSLTLAIWSLKPRRSSVGRADRHRRADA